MPLNFDQSDVNVNSTRLENRRKELESDSREFARFKLHTHLDELKLIDDEAYCYRLKVLLDAARDYGYDVNWPTDALQYESTVLKSTKGHRCVRTVCRSVLFREPKKLLCAGKLLKGVYGHPCTGVPCIVCTQLSGEMRTHQHGDHACKCQRCDQFTLPKNTTFRHPETGKELVSSGTVFVCQQTGAVHICPLNERCDRTYINTQDRTQGYVCRLSGRVKDTAICSVPEYDENRKIANSRIKKIKDAEEEGDQMLLDEEGKTKKGNEDDAGDEEFDFDDQEEDDDAANNMLEHIDNSDSLEAVGNAKTAKLDDQLASLTRLSDVVRIAGTNDVDEIVNRLIEFSPKRKDTMSAIQTSASKRPRVRTPLANLSPENKTLHYLKNHEDREQRVRQIFRLLTSDENKTTMYRAALWDASREASERVDSAKRKTTHRELTTSECGSIWYGYVLPKLPPAPAISGRPLDIELFTTTVLNAWELCARSPAAVENTPRKRGSLNLTKIVFAVLYMISDSGHKCKCGLDSTLLGTDTLIDDVDLRTLSVQVLPPSRALPMYIVPRDQLISLQRLIHTSVVFSDKTAFEGQKLFKQCLQSTYDGIVQRLINDLTLPDTVRVDRLRQYITECQALKC